MLLLAFRNLRARLGRTLFTDFAIALGVALVFATRIVGIAAEEQAAAARASKLAGADLEVSPARAQFFPVSITDDILQNPAVEKVAPVYKHSLTQSQLELLGVDPARVLTPYELIVGEFLSDLTGFDGEILLPDIWAAQHGLGVGQTVRLTIEGETYEYKVVGLLKANPFGTPKAVPAALIMAATRSLLRACALEGGPPGQVLERVNDLLQPDIPPKMFVTCLYGVLDPAGGRLHYANAGHPLPFRRLDGEVAELRARGMPLGLLPGMRYEEKETTLVPGEGLLLYSDGLVEAHNHGGEMFGFPRLGGLIMDRPRGVTLIGFLLAELRRFTGGGREQ